MSLGSLKILYSKTYRYIRTVVLKMCAIIYCIKALQHTTSFLLKINLKSQIIVAAVIQRCKPVFLSLGVAAF